ncbi:MAG: 5-deoxy-glucuronate isomerase [Bacilli bacterium]
MFLNKAKEQTGYREIVGDDNGLNLKFLRFGLLTLAQGETYTGRMTGCEGVLVLLSGSMDVTVGDAEFTGLKRQDVFTGKAAAVFVPAGSSFSVINAGGASVEAAICRTPADQAFDPFVVRPDEVWSRQVGKDNYRREVHDIVVKNAEGRVQRIIVGETFNPPGNWSSFPPHKHDDYKPDVEACMEEVYHYRMNPRQGFGLQSIYTGDRSLDEVYRVEDGDTFMIPYGYHPVCAAGGYQLYYLWFMAGETGRAMIPSDDPRHAWVRE